MVMCSALTFFYSIFLLAGGSVLFATTNSTSSEQVVFISIMVVGGIVLCVSALGAFTLRYRYLNVVKAFGVFTLLILTIEFVLGCVLLNYVNRLAYVPTVTYSQEITKAPDVRVSDFVNSVYVTCCTGCTIATCGSDVTPFTTPYCDQSIPSNPACETITACPSDGSKNTTNCFLEFESSTKLPPFDISEGVCDFLSSAGWSEYNVPVVGNSGGVERSCGGGNPKVFQLAVAQWARSNYSWVASLLAALIIIHGVTLFSAMRYYEYCVENPLAVVPFDNKRPWGDDDAVGKKRKKAEKKGSSMKF